MHIINKFEKQTHRINSHQTAYLTMTNENDLLNEKITTKLPTISNYSLL